MQDPFINLFRQAVSEKRLAAYKKQGREDNLQSVANYIWNIKLCESLYPALHGIEIALRNHIHNVASEAFQTNYWFNRLELTIIQQNMLDKAILQLKRNNKPSDEPDRIIAELTFRFWSLFFSRKFEHFWRPRLKIAFPYTPKAQRKLKAIMAHLEAIRLLRNRVFHHEPIWKLKDLESQHQQLLETIKWFNPTLKQTIQVFDAFPQVYEQGSDFYHDILIVKLITFLS